jgi:hypothetical protein
MIAMVRTIGFFESDAQVVRAVEALEAQGFGPEAVRVIAGTSDQASRVDTETAMPVDRIRENGSGSWVGEQVGSADGIPLIPFGMVGAAYLVNPPGYAAPGSADGYAGPALGAAIYDEKGEAKRQLNALGLDDRDSDACLERIERGDLLLVVDSDRTGRPYVESALREGGASTIL